MDKLPPRRGTLCGGTLTPFSPYPILLPAPLRPRSTTLQALSPLGAFSQFELSPLEFLYPPT